MNDEEGSGGSNGDRSLISQNWLARSEAITSKSLEGVSLGLRKSFSNPCLCGFE